MEILFDVVLALFFVYGLYSALWEAKLFVRRKRSQKRRGKVDKNPKK